VQVIIVFLEGVITFISPCLLPMVPIYLSYFAGGGERNRKKTVLNAMGFVAGFSAVFLAMGILASTVGRLLQRYHSVLNVILGAAVIFLGLNYLGVLRLNIFRGGVGKADTHDMTVGKSFLFGTVFAVGWTPCVGTFLGSALMLAGSQETVLRGAFLLLVYSLGLGIPFLLSALLVDEVKGASKWVKRHYTWINRISGAFLILVGVLMCFGVLDRVLAFLQ
jgi:cytochrome c-type biogenesis protein